MKLENSNEIKQVIQDRYIIEIRYLSAALGVRVKEVALFSHTNSKEDFQQCKPFLNFTLLRFCAHKL